MIGASKILTVSYGTFSCTLEGFDDPFNTMRAIAEYFRDLAAEDRYFGAEPPTPDAAMLHKIAEREVQRRVEAKINENGVILRTGDAMESPSFVAAPQPQPEVMVAAPAPQSAPQSTPMPDGVAAKLMRIRAAVANAELAEPRSDAAAPVATAPLAPAPLDPILADYSEDQHADDLAITGELSAAFAPETALADIEEAVLWVSPETTAPTDAVLPAEMPAEDPTPEDLAAVDIAAVDFAEVAVETALAPPDNGIDFTDDVFAEDAFSVRYVQPDTAPSPATYAADTTDADNSLLDALNSVAAASPAAETVDADMIEDDLAADDDLAALDGAPATDLTSLGVADDDLAGLYALDGASVEAETDGPADADQLADEETERAADFGYDEDPEAEAEADAEENSLDVEFDDAFATAAPAAEDIDPAIEEIDRAYEIDPDTQPKPGPSEKALRARARVIKVRRADAADDAALPPDTTTGAESMFAADDEGELGRDLHALQSSGTAPDAGVSDDDTETGPEDDARQRLEGAGEAAVSRLIEQTNEAMAVPENRRRLSAIAHLKAAVAATVAERFAKGGSAPKEAETKRLDPYREDLARVVRPQDPTASDEARPTPRPAPLVLVSAQRIDRPRATPNDNAPNLSTVQNNPVRPRRVTSAAVAVEAAPLTEVEDEEEFPADANIFADARKFAEFSEHIGANNLAEILEAAAAYSVGIEGRPYFSRPELMGRIGALSADSDFSREDGLRTFGAMLREGRIQKIKRGRFVLTEESRYLAMARKLTD